MTEPCYAMKQLFVMVSPFSALISFVCSCFSKFADKILQFCRTTCYRITWKMEDAKWSSSFKNGGVKIVQRILHDVL